MNPLSVWLNYLWMECFLVSEWMQFHNVRGLTQSGLRIRSPVWLISYCSWVASCQPQSFLILLSCRSQSPTVSLDDCPSAIFHSDKPFWAEDRAPGARRTFSLAAPSQSGDFYDTALWLPEWKRSFVFLLLSFCRPYQIYLKNVLMRNMIKTFKRGHPRCL